MVPPCSSAGACMRSGRVESDLALAAFYMGEGAARDDAEAVR
jgi:hypothetical protein